MWCNITSSQTWGFITLTPSETQSTAGLTNKTNCYYYIISHSLVTNHFGSKGLPEPIPAIFGHKAGSPHQRHQCYLLQHDAILRSGGILPGATSLCAPPPTTAPSEKTMSLELIQSHCNSNNHLLPVSYTQTSVSQWYQTLQQRTTWVPLLSAVVTEKHQSILPIKSSGWCWGCTGEGFIFIKQCIKATTYLSIVSKEKMIYNCTWQYMIFVGHLLHQGFLRLSQDKRSLLHLYSK